MLSFVEHRLSANPSTLLILYMLACVSGDASELLILPLKHEQGSTIFSDCSPNFRACSGHFRVPEQGLRFISRVPTADAGRASECPRANLLLVDQYHTNERASIDSYRRRPASN